MSEADNVRLRYARRERTVPEDRYSMLDEVVMRTVHERHLALARWIRQCDITPLSSKRIIEIGCGHGANILDLLRMGALPENIVGNDLLEDRCQHARRLLPTSVELLQGDATLIDIKDESYDIVIQSTVFSSILDESFQDKLANTMWRWVRSGGGVLWYDFIYNNPRNPDVRGVTMRRVAELFPDSTIKTWRVTLAPPIARKIPPCLYSLFNLPFLRTHVLCWIEKK